MAAPAFARTTRALAVDSGRGAGLAMVVAAVLLALWLAWFLFARITVWQPSLNARLEVRSSSRVVTAASGGRLVASGLYAGRQVRAGEVLARFESTAEALALSAAEARLAGFPTRLAALRSRLAAAAEARGGAAREGAAALAAARARLHEAAGRAEATSAISALRQADAEAGGSAPLEARSAEADAASARAARDARSGEVAAIAGESEARSAHNAGELALAAEALAALEAEQAVSVAEVARLHLALDQKLVRSPVDGVVGEVGPVRLGEAVPPGARLATIVPAGGLHVTANFDAARSLGRLAPGQVARLRLDGFSWAQYGEIPARVERVAAEPSGSALRVDLAIAPPAESDVPLRHGMSGSVEVATEEIAPMALVLRAIGRLAA